MDKYIKRIQSKLTYRGQSATKEQCRKAYQSLVADPNAPTEPEIELVVARLAAPKVEVASSTNLVPVIAQQEELEVAPPSIAEITPESPSVLETIQPMAEETVKVTSPKEEGTGGLAIADNHSHSLDTPAVGVTQQQIQSAVAQKFASSPSDIKAQVVGYASQLAFSSAKEMEQMLQQLRETELSVMMQIIATHNTDRDQTLKAFQEALANAEQSRKEQSSDFFAQFNRQMAEMKAAFGA